MIANNTNAIAEAIREGLEERKNMKQENDASSEKDDDNNETED